MSYKLIAISGSMRAGSFNTSLVRAFKEHAPEGVEIDIVDFKDIPLYNQDDEAAFPEVVTALKERITAADGIIVSTPEYNRSIPGVLKNMIDWTSRPWQQGAWTGKPVFVVGASGGPIGTALAQYDLKKTMLFMNAHVMGQPEFYAGTVTSKFDAEGNLTDEDTSAFIKSGLEAFTKYIDQVSR